MRCQKGSICSALTADLRLEVAQIVSLIVLFFLSSHQSQDHLVMQVSPELTVVCASRWMVLVPQHRIQLDLVIV